MLAYWTLCCFTEVLEVADVISVEKCFILILIYKILPNIMPCYIIFIWQVFFYRFILFMYSFCSITETKVTGIVNMLTRMFQKIAVTVFWPSIVVTVVGFPH